MILNVITDIFLIEIISKAFKAIINKTLVDSVLVKFYNYEQKIQTVSLAKYIYFFAMMHISAITCRLS